MEFTIRSARESDLPVLLEVGHEGYQTLLDAGGIPDMAAHDDDTGDFEDELREYLEKGLLLAAVNGDDRPIGYGSALPGGDCFHICQLDVARAAQRRGIGRALMSALIDEGRKQGFRAITLTTDRFVPFNARFYETLGFRILEANELDDRLGGILASEAEKGLDPARRCAMMLDFGY